MNYGGTSATADVQFAAKVMGTRSVKRVNPAKLLCTNEKVSVCSTFCELQTDLYKCEVFIQQEITFGSNLMPRRPLLQTLIVCQHDIEFYAGNSPCSPTKYFLIFYHRYYSVQELYHLIYFNGNTLSARSYDRYCSYAGSSEEGDNTCAAKLQSC